jgi:hypothetical protein
MAVLLACFTAFSLQAQSDATVTITAPASVAGDYAARQAVFGPGLTTDISGAIVEGVDTAGLTTVCDSIGNDLTGAIALVDRGACGFVAKVTNAQSKGAVAAIVCNNNQDAPNQAIVMGGDDMGTITIPSVMLSYNQCQTIRAELANGLAGTLTISNLIPSPTGTVCEDPTVITAAGTYSATLDEGYGGLFGGSGNAAFYSYTPSQNTLITVTSCNTTSEDTRLIIIDNCTDVNVLAFNDDCDPDNGNFSSELTWLGTAGTEYLILWDDRWSGAPFDWDLILASPPVVDVTVTVDMNAEATDDGGYILGSFNGWSSTAMTDNMDGTYSYTITGITAGDSIEYLFQNGFNVDQEVFAQGSACTITDPSGTFTNRLLVPGIENSSLAAVCFNSCEDCPPPACTDPDAIICDDMEEYVVDLISAQASHWLPWGGTAGAADDATVSTDFAASGSQSLLVSEANGDDMLLLLGDQTTGNYLLTWKMYIPDGSTGYFNTQKEEGNPGGEFGMQVEFFTDGTSTLDAGASDVVTYDWAADTWMELSLSVDLTNDWMTYSVNGEEIYSWPASWGTFTQSGTLQLGAINFFGNTGTTQYIDDVLFKSLPECPANAIICDSYEAYETGSTTGGQAPWWATWGGAVGGADDGIVSDDFAATGTNSMLIAEAQVQDVIMLLGGRSEGVYSLRWQTYIPAGKTGYFNIQESETPGVAWNLDVFYNQDAGAAGTGVIDQTGTTFTYPEDEWFEVRMVADLDGDLIHIFMDGVFVETADFTGNLGAINFFSIDADNRYYIDDVYFQDLPSCSADALICDNIETYEEDSRTGGQSTWWSTWSGTFGGADDGLVSGDQAASGANSVLIAEGQTQDVILLLGNKTSGQYNLSWKTYIPSGATGYYNIQESETPGVAWNLDVFYNADGGAPGTGTVDQSGNTFSYPEDQWFTVEHFIDLDGNTMTLTIDGVEVETTDYTGNLGAINFFSIDATNRYYIDDVLYEALTPNPVDVTFNVNMANETVDAAGAHIAGEFNGWSSVPMTDNGDGTYSFTTQLLPGDSVEYKFQNGENTNWEEFAGGEECTITDPSGAFTNRLLVVEDMAMDLGLVCFNECADCTVGAEDLVFQNGIEVFPNPASDLTNITFNFAESNDITIELVNKLGQRISFTELDNIQNASHELSVNNLAAGMYFIHISNGEASMVEKLFVE